MSVLEQIYFWIAVVATILLIVQIIVMLVSFGGMDADADGVFDTDGDMDGDGGLSFFSLKSITAFFALGGWAGYTAAIFLPNIWAPVLISLAAGTVALVGVGFAMRGIAKLQCSGNLVTEKLQGQTATVYVSIPPQRQGRGKITLTAQGKFSEFDAMTDEAEKLKADEQVVILSMDGDCALVARKKQESAEENKNEAPMSEI